MKCSPYFISEITYISQLCNLPCTWSPAAPRCLASELPLTQITCSSWLCTWYKCSMPWWTKSSSSMKRTELFLADCKSVVCWCAVLDTRAVCASTQEYRVGPCSLGFGCLLEYGGKHCQLSVVRVTNVNSSCKLRTDTCHRNVSAFHWFTYRTEMRCLFSLTNNLLEAWSFLLAFLYYF